jgi:membrane associated rhomboid family serine protease
VDATSTPDPQAEETPRDLSTWPLDASGEKASAFSVAILMLIFSASLAAIGAIGPPLGHPENPSPLGAVLGALLGLGIGFLLYWFYGRKTPAETIRLDGEGLAILRSPHSDKVRFVAYRDIQALSFSDSPIGASWQGKLLLIATPEKTLHIPVKRFVFPNTADRFITELRKRIAELDDGEQRLEALDRRKAANRSAHQRWPLFTHAICILLLVPVFALDDPLRLIQLGACVPALVFDGEWYRLLTYAFLHANFEHLMLNLIALMAVGSVIERVLGRWRLLLVFWIAAVTGSLASALFGEAFMMVGASAGVFGLLGALAMLHLKHWADVPVAMRQNVAWWVVILGLNFSLPLLVPQIDWIAHLGGMAGGALVAWLSVLPEKSFRIPPPAGWLLKAAASTMTALGLGAVVFIFVSGQPDLPFSKTGVARKLESAGPITAPVANTLAWELATDDRAERKDLELAKRLATKAVAAKPGEWAYLDTLSYIHYRLGIFEPAIELQLEVIGMLEAAGGNPHYHVSRLSVMLQAYRAQADEPFHIGEAAGVRAQLAYPRPNARGKVLELTVVEPCDGELLAWIPVRVKGAGIAGTIRVRIDGSRRRDETLAFSSAFGASRFGPEGPIDTFELVAGLVACKPAARPEKPVAQYWKWARRASGLHQPLHEVGEAPAR